ncbi:MAG TPA: hypothetical protein VMB26_12065 [Candidatus Binataceae bacterium]|nr:hypothetical protein [Candidatus Binataceae bacterium]
MQTISANEVKKMLAELGVSVGDEDANRLASGLGAILADLHKLDEVEGEEGELTPRFAVEDI